MTETAKLHDHVEQAKNETSFLLTFIFLVSTIMTGLGLHAILPDDNWIHYLQVFILAGAVFACLKLIWSYQMKLYVYLASGKPSNTLTATHFGAIILTFCLSMPTTYVALSWVMSSDYDMQVVNKHVVGQSFDAKRNFHASQSIQSFVDAKGEEMLVLASEAKSGVHTKIKGEGAVYRTYKQARGNFKRLSKQIDEQRDTFESAVRELDLAQSKMRHALEADLPLKEKVTRFEKAYREHTDQYTKIMELDLARLIETNLKSFNDKVSGSSQQNKVVRDALSHAQNRVGRVVGDVMEHVQANTTVLKPIEPYQLPAPSIVSFRHIQQFWMQALLSCAIDLSILISVWMQICALRAKRATDGNFTQH